MFLSNYLNKALNIMFLLNYLNKALKIIVLGQTWWDGGEHHCEQGQARADEQADGRLCRGQDYTTGFFLRETKTKTNTMTKTTTKTKTMLNASWWTTFSRARLLDRLRLKRDKDKNHYDVLDEMGEQCKLIDDFIGGKITRPAVAFRTNLQYKVVNIFFF